MANSYIHAKQFPVMCRIAFNGRRPLLLCPEFLGKTVDAKT